MRSVEAGVGAEVEEDIKRYMPDVIRSETQLASLDDAWEHIKRLAEVTCSAGAQSIIDSMKSTQDGFKELQEKLIHNLILEQLKKSNLEIRSKAQVAVDILIRNLFERSADVGFLSTDGDIRAFLASPENTASDVTFIEARLKSYASKYTVYDEIILIDAEGKVRAHLDHDNPITGLEVTDQIFATTLGSTAPFNEFFKETELQPKNQKSLIFSCKVTHESKPDSPAVGVLCLCFKFENEMKGIFQRLKREGDRSLMGIMDSHGTIIASSDIHHVALDTVLEKQDSVDVKISEFGGREYLSQTCPTKGYQGYRGLGWFGHVMISCDHAFHRSAHNVLQDIDKNIIDQITSLSSSISPVLADIAQRANVINAGLRRVVWNGQVMSKMDGDGTSRLKAVLSQISDTGGKTIEVFSKSIQNLHETVISSSLDDVKFLANLAIDIMDRNLYERSDDCRWWALTSEFRRILSSDLLAEEDLARLHEILVYINELYTVY